MGKCIDRSISCQTRFQRYRSVEVEHCTLARGIWTRLRNIACMRKPLTRAGILTISDTASRGGREDLSGQAIRELVASIGVEVAEYRIVPDEAESIAAVLREWADERRVDLILTTGGTGLSPRDVTPEATRLVLTREIPGMAEAMRLEGLKKTPRAMLSRAVGGARGSTLIVNLPGSPKGVRESLGAILEVIPHALEILQARPSDH